MRFRYTTLISIALITISIMAGPASGAVWEAGILLGYSGGPGGQINGMVSEFSPGFPLALRLGIGYTSVDPGNALGARQVFINDATNGTPQQKGWFWDYRFDFVYQFGGPNARTFGLYFGPRYAKYTSNFNFIGGNEDFDVNSNQWGLGAGLDGVFDIGTKAALVLTGGLDYYAEGQLSGHDTSYDPDGEDVNGRKAYSYADADQVINQPKLEPRFMLGINYRFGH